MVVDGHCVARRSAVLSMSWHRELTTGAVAARFFEQIVVQLNRPITGTLSSELFEQYCVALRWAVHCSFTNESPQQLYCSSL